MKNVDLSRRSFVAGAALAAGAAGVAGAVPLARADEVTWDGTYDVIVCGGGGSGLTAAYSALEQGAEKVLVLEKGDACGGTTATAEGAVQASGTTWQKELGVNGVDDDSADKHYAFWMQDGEGLVDPDLVRVMADNAADNLQWMADSFGITYSKVFGCYPAAYTDPANMADRIHLITDAADATKTGGVVWTTNAEAAKTQAVATAATDTGDGIVMGIEAGADVGRFGGAVDLLLATWSYTNNTNPEIPYILVNQRGVRFVREDTTYAFHCRAIYNACIQEGGFDDEAGTTGCTWMVMDNKMTSVSQAAWSDPDKLQEALDDGSMVTGQTIEELADAMGVDPDVLKFSVDKWNDDVAAGKDSLYGREVQLTTLDEAPFYAWKTVNTNIGSIGGLKITTDAQVVDRAGEPIAHLFAAGTNSGGWLGPYYPGSGTCLQGTLNWGRIAGASAAKA